jgi:hypothetical protein
MEDKGSGYCHYQPNSPPSQLYIPSCCITRSCLTCFPPIPLPALPPADLTECLKTTQRIGLSGIPTGGGARTRWTGVVAPVGMFVSGTSACALRGWRVCERAGFRDVMGGVGCTASGMLTIGSPGVVKL